MPTIHGSVAPGFERVAVAFAQHIAPDTAAQCSVHLAGEPVVDLWAGYREDAIQVVFSATKGATAACANLLVQRGLLDLGAPVTAYWPEYGAHGKDKTLVRWLLSHKAGVLAPAPGLSMGDLGDWERIVASLAAQPPAWEPGSAYGYHAHTFGWLVGELVRRVDGRSLGRFFAEELAGPAGADFWIGLPASEEHRVAPVSLEPPQAPADFDPTTLDLSAYMGPYSALTSTLNGMLPDDLEALAADRRYRAAELGAAGGVASGRGLSRLYAWLLDAFTAETIANTLHSETVGPDLVLSSPALPLAQSIGRGFSVSPPCPALAGVPTFGHTGAGGSIGFADPQHQVAFGYATTRLRLGPPGNDSRVAALVTAVYDALG